MGAREEYETGHMQKMIQNNDIVIFKKKQKSLEQCLQIMRISI